MDMAIRANTVRQILDRKQKCCIILPACGTKMDTNHLGGLQLFRSKVDNIYDDCVRVLKDSGTSTNILDNMQTTARFEKCYGYWEHTCTGHDRWQVFMSPQLIGAGDIKKSGCLRPSVYLWVYIFTFLSSEWMEMIL